MAVLTKKSPYTQQQTSFPAIPGILHLYKTGHGALHILDTDKQTRLYDIKTHSFSSPDVSLYRPAAAAAAPNASPTLCGFAKFHTCSFTIDLQIGGKGPIPLKAIGLFTTSRTFESCLGELKWKQDMKLLNAREELLATFTHVTAKSKMGRFELAPRVAEGGQRLVDEIVLSGVALLEQERRITMASAVGDVGGAVGGAVGAAV